MFTIKERLRVQKRERGRHEVYNTTSTNGCDDFKHEKNLSLDTISQVIPSCCNYDEHSSLPTYFISFPSINQQGTVTPFL